MEPMSRQTLPEPYLTLDDDAIAERIVDAKKALGSRLVILGHHYQRDDVIRHADVTGDSFKLARLGAERTDAEYVVFCGVHFMAESADILRAPHQTVILPDLNAGCSMADMAPTEDVLEAGATLERLGVTDVTPVTYMNSTADIKAFCGERGGAVCTSSNARAVFEWAFRRREKVFFLPDEHLGRNTAMAMGIPPAAIVVWDPMKEQGGLTAEAIEGAKAILWKGCCSVHTKFQRRHVDERRAEDPGVRILVHPEDPHAARGPGGQPLGGRDRVQPGAPDGSGDARQEDRHSVPRLLHLRYHVPDLSAESVVGAGAPGRGRGREPDPRSRAHAHLGESRSRPHAPGHLSHPEENDGIRDREGYL